MSRSRAGLTSARRSAPRSAGPFPVRSASAFATRQPTWFVQLPTWYRAPAGTGLRFIANIAVGGDWPGNPDSSTWATADGARYLKVSSITHTPYHP